MLDDPLNRLTEPQKQLLALGRFVLCYADVEHVLLLNLCSLGNVPEEFTRAALSGVRVDAAIDYIRRLFNISNAERAKCAAYEEVFTHLKSISAARNLILHHGINWAGHDIGYIASDHHRAISQKKIKWIPVTPEILNQMSEDLTKITTLLVNYLVTHQRDPTCWQPNENARQTSRRPWLYKPPQPNRAKKKLDSPDRQKGKTRGHRPQSSRG